MAARVNKDEFEGKVLKAIFPFWLIFIQTAVFHAKR